MKRLKFGDYIIVAVVVALILLLFSRTFGFKGDEKYIEITGVNFQEEYDPGDDRVVEVPGPLGMTRVVIKDGRAWVEDSPCRDKVCIRMGKVSRPGEEAICLPNRVIVQMKGRGGSVDGVSR
jgi:hypothetical protein